MYQSTSSSSSSQKSMVPGHGGAGVGGGGGGGGGGGLTRYGSAPGSLLTSAVDSVIASRHPEAAAASLRTPPSFGGHYFSSADSSVVESSRKVVQSSSTSNDLKSSSSAAAAALQRTYGIHDLALGDFSTARNFSNNGGQSSSSSPLVRQRSSPAGFLGHLSVAEATGGFSLTRGGSYSSQNGNGGRVKSQLSFSGQESLSGMSESVVEGTVNSSTNANTTHSHSFGFAMDDSWDTSNNNTNNSIVFAAPSSHSSKRSKHHSDADFFNCLTALESQFSLPQTSLEMATVERLLQIPEDSVPCKIRAKRGCATHPRSIAERERRTRISGKLKKLQELVPNMDKQTSYADMLDLAVQHIKGLQNQIQKLNKEVENCTCGSKESS